MIRSPSSSPGKMGGGSPHFSHACGQRGWKRQPRGHAAASGTNPGIDLSRLSVAESWGREARSPCVYGCAGARKISSTVPDSTIWPAYMTRTRSETSAITPRSCVMRTTPILRRSLSFAMRARICAWMVTSSAVVGSSAMRSAGSRASPIAIMTRWRIPPES